MLFDSVRFLFGSVISVRSTQCSSSMRTNWLADRTFTKQWNDNSSSNDLNMFYCQLISKWKIGLCRVLAGGYNTTPKHNEMWWETTLSALLLVCWDNRNTFPFHKNAKDTHMYTCTWIHYSQKVDTINVFGFKSPEMMNEKSNRETLVAIVDG